MSSSISFVEFLYLFSLTRHSFIKFSVYLSSEAQTKIETIISDEGTIIKASIIAISPDAFHKLCAWHISKAIGDKNVRMIFGELLRCPQIQFTVYLN